MKALKRVLSAFICILLLITALPVSAQFDGKGVIEDGYLKIANFTVTLPVAGEKPSTEVVSDVSEYVTLENIQWKGTFDENGCFIGENEYTIRFDMKIRDGVELKFHTSSRQRYFHVNEKYISAGLVLDGGKTFVVSTKFEAPRPVTQVDARHFTRQYADSVWWDNNPKLFVADTVEKVSWMGKLVRRDEQDSVTRVIVDCAGASPLFMKDAHNITEVWLSPKVDVARFLTDYISAFVNPDMQYKPYGMESNGAKTWHFKLYAPEEQLPEGLLTIGDSYDERLIWFETLLYSGDVFEAYEKHHGGESVVKTWCPGHEYTREISTADRVMIEMDCMHNRWFCYSCRICGKPEMNYAHLHSKNMAGERHSDIEAHALHDYADTMEIKASNYIGQNAEGEYVYLKSCVFCGQNTEDIVKMTNMTREDYYANVGGESTYEYAKAQAAKMWESRDKANALKATVKEDAILSFAVKSAPVNAVVSTWAENEVNWAKEKGLLDEALLGDNYQNPINRLQFCSVAVRLAETFLQRELEPAPSGTFSDTDDLYVRKAFAAGITTGTGNGQFSPYATLNRQQMATFIHRALMYVRNNSGVRYTIYDSKLASYSDAWLIADWATEPMAFMNALGLVKGTSDTTLAPTDNCTVEQAILVGYRSLYADQIGWYQCIRSNANETVDGLGSVGNKNFYYGPGGGHIQATYGASDRIWISGPKIGTLKNRGIAPTVHPYTGKTCWVSIQEFWPVKDMD